MAVVAPTIFRPVLLPSDCTSTLCVPLSREGDPAPLGGAVVYEKQANIV